MPFVRSPGSLISYVAGKLPVQLQFRGLLRLRSRSQLLLHQRGMKTFCLAQQKVKMTLFAESSASGLGYLRLFVRRERLRLSS